MNSEIVEDIKIDQSKKKYSYDTKKYMDTYIEKHRDDKIKCPDCGKIYSIFNKSHHKKSVYHLKITNYIKENQLTI
jgi:effector-binding domain-containing protein